MVYFLYGLFFFSCLLLVAAVLLQPGKTDAGALFTSNVSSTAFSPRGTATVLSKVTIAAAITFMLSALMLSMPAVTGQRSVLSSNPEAPVEAPAEIPAEEVPSISNSNGVDPNAVTNTANGNDNSALIENPATEAFQEKVAEEASNANRVIPGNSNTENR